MQCARRCAIHDSKYGTTRVLFASTYTAKQLKTIYYSLSVNSDAHDHVTLSFSIVCQYLRPVTTVYISNSTTLLNGYEGNYNK